MSTHQAPFKTFMIKSCCLTLGAFLLSACAQKFNDMPNEHVLKTCPSPLANYQLANVKRGDHNDLNLANTEMQQLVENSLTQSGCFSPSQTTANDTNPQTIPYQLEIIFGSINTQNKRKGLLRSQTSDEAIIEVQFNFSKPNEMLVFRGKSNIQQQNTKYLVLFGSESKLNPNQIQITLQNAINSAVNEAIRNLTQIQNTPPQTPKNSRI